ncbi:SGNH/GDSL hydrolase family protein [Polyangium aurulentum]|nr:SGNH/GDSL hydrolase family protein [Polyangium aurulentum]
MMGMFLYAALGDSSGIGIGACDGHGYVSRTFTRLSRAVPRAELMNLCISGATSSTVLERQVDRAAAAKPALVTLFIGGNDLWRLVEPARFKSNLEAIAARLDKTGAPVLLGSLPNMAHAPAATYAESHLGISKGMIENRVRSFNKAIEEVAVRHSFTLVDLFNVGLADRPHYFCDDGFHPSAEGYAAWADLLWPFMERAITTAA